jgi:hypothetical protein
MPFSDHYSVIFIMIIGFLIGIGWFIIKSKTRSWLLLTNSEFLIFESSYLLGN